MKSLLKEFLSKLPFISVYSNANTGNFVFPDAAKLYQNRLIDFWSRESFPISQSQQPCIGIVVTPFIFTPAPFFAIEFGLQLCAQGKNVVFFWDAQDVFFNATRPREIEAIAAALAKVSFSIRIVDVSKIIPSPSLDCEFLPELIQENAVRHLRGEGQVDAFLRDNPHLEEAMRLHCGRVSRLLKEEPVDLLIIPGGIWASCGIYFKCAKASGIPLTTYDSGPGQLFIAQNSVAAHFEDVPLCLARIIAEANQTEITCAISLAESAILRRMRGQDAFQLQKTPRNKLEKSFDLIVPLNLRFDSAALCRHHLFKSITDWLVHLLEWVESRPNVSIAVRQHPCERLDDYKGKDDWGALFTRFPGLEKRLQFFDAFADVNTYDLIESSRVVLPFTSRVGIEAAMMGKPVITCADCYYANCGFTSDPSEPEAYFAAIDAALHGELSPGNDARKNAQLVYYFMEYCTALETKFTPHPSNYHEWTSIAPSLLAMESQVKTALFALSAEESLSWLLHKKIMQENT